MKMTYKEFLGIYIYKNPSNQIQKKYNQAMLMKAEGIRSIRIQRIINEEFGFLDKQQQKEDFLKYFKSVAWLRVYTHFENFVNAKCLFGEITVDLCRKFREYLLHANQFKHSSRKLTRNSAAGYFSTFRALLKIIFRDKLIRENINEYLDKIEYQDVKKNYLTKEELGLLAETPCEFPILKAASLFSCLTGLRISDIINLKWEEIEPATEGGFSVRIRTEKTNTEATLPISNEALELCGPRTNGTVFKGLHRGMLQKPLKNMSRKNPYRILCRTQPI